MGHGDALERAWRLYRQEWRDVVAVTALAYAAVVFLTAVLIFTIGPFGAIPAAYVWLATLYWLQAPLARLVEDKRGGGEWRGARATFASIYPQLGRITGGGSVVALIVASLLVAFPLTPVALYFMTRWALLVPVVAVENVGLFTAFSRARELAKGHMWDLFWRIALSFLLLLLVGIGVGIATAVLTLFDVPLWLSLGGFAVIAFAALVLATPVIALAWTMSYYELRDQVLPEALDESRFHGGRTLDGAWRAYSAHPGRLILLCLPVALAISAIQVGAEQAHVLLALPATIALLAALAGVVALGLDSVEAGTVREWVSRTWSDATPRLPSLLATTVVLAAALTLTLPILVGVLLLVRWSVAGPASSVERLRPLAAVGRSSRLVRGQARRVAKVLFVTGVVLAVALAAGAAAAPTDVPYAGLVLRAAANTLAAPYVALAWAYMYRMLAGLPDRGPTRAAA